MGLPCIRARRAVDGQNSDGRRGARGMTRNSIAISLPCCFAVTLFRKWLRQEPKNDGCNLFGSQLSPVEASLLFLLSPDMLGKGRFCV